MRLLVVDKQIGSKLAKKLTWRHWSVKLSHAFLRFAYTLLDIIDLPNVFHVTNMLESEDVGNSVASASSSDLKYIQYGQDKENAYLDAIRHLISKDLSEPYSIYVYRYFLYQWGDLCYMVCLSILDRPMQR